jgi:drug/metabolite transporter (DMT)-like permease
MKDISVLYLIRAGAAMVHPRIGAALGFYTLQIVVFAYMFVKRWGLGPVSILQMAFYSVTCVVIGQYAFGERISLLHGIGMVLAICGAVLINAGK